jgi:hypothetical protein
MADPVTSGTAASATTGAAESVVNNLSSSEKLVASSTILQQIWQNLSQISQNPMMSGYFWQRLGTQYEQHLIARLKVTYNLTKDQSEALDEAYGKWQKHSMAMSAMAGAASGAALKIAHMTEELNKAAVGAAKFVQITNMPGGKAPFDEAVRRQISSAEMLGKYGSQFQKQFEATRDQLTMTLGQMGVSSKDDIDKIIKSFTALTTISGADIGSFAYKADAQFRSMGLNMLKAAGMAGDLNEQFKANKLSGRDFAEALDEILDTTGKLAPSLGIEKAYSAAVGISGLTAQKQYGAGEVKMLKDFMLNMRQYDSQQLQQSYLAANKLGLSPGGFDTFQRKFAGSEVQRAAALQKMAKDYAERNGITKDTDVTMLPAGQQAQLQAIFGKDLGLFRMLATSKDINTNLAITAKTLKDIDTTSIKLGNAAWMNQYKDTLENAPTYMEQVKAELDKITTSIASVVPKEASYLGALAIPALMMLSKRGRIFGMMEMARQLGGVAGGEEAGGHGANEFGGAAKDLGNDAAQYLMFKHLLKGVGGSSVGAVGAGLGIPAAIVVTPLVTATLAAVHESAVWDQAVAKSKKTGTFVQPVSMFGPHAGEAPRIMDTWSVNPTSALKMMQTDITGLHPAFSPLRPTSDPEKGVVGVSSVSGGGGPTITVQFVDKAGQTIGQATVDASTQQNLRIPLFVGSVLPAGI